ncbi:MAG: hypothetical protein HOP03_17450 [Lysobacter sp.]|nr:hypothetical protein [Lysobacter sp.]
MYGGEFRAFGEAGESMDRIGEKPSDWPVVLTVHGIRTTGDWQRELTDVLTQHKYRHVPLGFGFFSAVSLLMPWSRARKVEWFRRVYSDKFATAERLPSVIAHSFGSYIVTKAMMKYDDIRFDKMILCGSIVSRAYPWSKVLAQRNQASKVLNEAGGRDSWARLVEWVVSDAGSSGVSGFDDLADGRVVELIHERHEHSDYFYRRNFEQRWIPFLHSGSVQAVISAGGGGVNRKFAFTISMLIVLLVGSGWLAVEKYPLLVWPPDAFVPANTGEVETPAQEELPFIQPQTSMAAPAFDNVPAGDKPVNEWVTHLYGEWVQAGDLPQIVDDGVSSRCIRDRNTQTTLVFGSFDKAKDVISATWSQHVVAVHRLQALQPGPQPYEAAIRERKDCLGKKRGNTVERVLDEAGLFSVNVSGEREKPAEAKLKIESCILDGADCPATSFGDRSMSPLESIGEDRLRLGELMFIRQVGTSETLGPT